MNPAGRTAWVVGASSGIGAAVATELHARGATVAVSARREDRLADVAAGRMPVVPVDVTDASAVAAAAATVREALGPLDLVVIAAGYWRQTAVENWSTEEFDRHVAVNLSGTSNIVAAVLPDMLEQGRGTLAGIASVAGYRGLPGAEAYGATKAGQITLLEALRVAVARRGVRVVTVCPGFVETEMTAGNSFPMPFLIDADAAARAICDGLERNRVEIVFPLPMALVAKAARLVPARAWSAIWSRR